VVIKVILVDIRWSTGVLRLQSVQNKMILVTIALEGKNSKRRRPPPHIYTLHYYNSKDWSSYSLTLILILIPILILILILT
jgi:hypothetical protein